MSESQGALRALGAAAADVGAAVGPAAVRARLPSEAAARAAVARCALSRAVVRGPGFQIPDDLLSYESCRLFDY